MTTYNMFNPYTKMNQNVHVLNHILRTWKNCDKKTWCWWCSIFL